MEVQDGPGGWAGLLNHRAQQIDGAGVEQLQTEQVSAQLLRLGRLPASIALAGLGVQW
jgi:hypothetical protein